MRADARRNYDHLVATARAVFAEEGPDASLNEVARRAGVGPGTLYRHFPTRQALLVAVFRERIDTLCAHADDLAAHAAPGEALRTWLRAVLLHARTDGGLSATMASGVDLGFDCHARMRSAATTLLARAQRAGAVRAEVSADDLFKLVTGIAQVADDQSEGERLLALAVEGVAVHPS
ncbi:TetR/AcrR family transcriptional regulator [Nonomuraea africana]|uniref:AcrR family transcriptional regulator n=1 Tax=Nonomuraea africana TaxID=46171 RepID=A0ABR9KVN4_9ACTN|nr:TetR/AcrR family transcriptional regulator [Nonomuraea africana]MBE1566058.1 AcrR family transcriptional regulator [Nonomuraea africana]